MCWIKRQNGTQQVDLGVVKMDTSYTQSNAWPTEDEMEDLDRFRA